MKAAKSKSSAQDIAFEIGDVLRNAPDKPGGANFEKINIIF